MNLPEIDIFGDGNSNSPSALQLDTRLNALVYLFSAARKFGGLVELWSIYLANGAGSVGLGGAGAPPIKI